MVGIGRGLRWRRKSEVATDAAGDRGGFDDARLSRRGDSSPEGWMTRVIWGSLSSIRSSTSSMFVGGVDQSRLDTQPGSARGLKFKLCRLVNLVFITWAVYPIAYAIGGTEAALAAKRAPEWEPPNVVRAASLVTPDSPI